MVIVCIRNPCVRVRDRVRESVRVRVGVRVNVKMYWAGKTFLLSVCTPYRYTFT